MQTYFRRAVEEAKELADQRAGRQPATDHRPADFLVPSVDWDADVDMQYPAGPSASDAAALTAAALLEWLAAAAAAPEHALQVCARARVRVRVGWRGGGGRALRHEQT